MATAETQLDLKIFFQKEKNKVLFAEANGDFVDVLFSFLTLPLGTIVRLIEKTTRAELSNLGCFSNLYQSVKSLGDEHFRANVFRQMLIQPRSSSEDRSRMLKINIDDTEAKYFSCPPNKYNRSCKFLSIYRNTKCPGNCSKPFSIVRSLVFSTRSSKVYVTAASKFIITEDLEVKPVVPGTVTSLLNDLGIDDMSLVGEQIMKLGSKEVLQLLKLTLLSPTPLTDLFLSKETLSDSSNLLKRLSSDEQSNKDWEVNVKVVVKKSSKEFLFVEAGQDFIDFVFSFLIIPLGEMLHILDGQSCIGNIDSLYKSVRSLDSQFLISEGHRNVLLRPKLPPHLGLNNSLFKLESTPLSCEVDGIVWTMPVDATLSVARGSGGFLRKETSFLVSDGLMITPLSVEPIISIYSKMNVSVSDVEERTLSLGMAEGISILRASLTSSSAISDGLLQNGLIFKEPKRET